MSGKLKSLVFAGFAFLLLSLPAFAQMTSLEGTVKGPDGKPLNGATIQLERTDIKGQYTIKTDKKGHYGHYGLPAGTYDVTVILDGKPVAQQKHVTTKYNGVPPLDFDLAKMGATEAADAPDKSMSAADKANRDKATKEREAQLAKNKELNDAFNAGKTALDAKQYDQAIDSFTKASAMDDKQVVVWSGLADAYVGAAGQKSGADSAALYDKGFEAYKKAIELKPDDAAYYNNYAIALAKDKKLDEAKTNLDKAAQLDPPGAGKYFYNMGALLVNGNQTEAAGEQFKKAIDADPTYADAQYQYGIYLASKANTDPSGKVIAVPGTIEALQKYIDLKGPACASATATSAPAGCENVGAAKGMIEQFGGTLNTSYTNPNATQQKKGGKK
jgi:tetratricopeptide (TPR) repeat protein